ncbi:AtpZ/AtpI family protein [Paramaledivibacter caminithermalis]|jgi:F0F1-type ATP synthase assembly protein I|uniref:Putative F0F1-ATPase subunit Ca2+/Mg2+ transporter n=1 Tax=Paramaledivibacter caminithermalis (strain DSM 15212 / CIP 107654 / DViRD3) TaxID=1121301 RepID=A0A1M6L339_PARC5|nr:AtpZ/AtpI family protein [Paramaledivibacter caminithermalis]SHJ65534.1 Putative F0F1-ATPase subunit Ca2+/Mg2+ transporter [Paramaledivibacter caminithermalis DSM 15212]
MKNGKYKIYENLAFVTQIGLMMIIPIVISVLLGHYIDEKLGTGNLFLLIFIALGVASSFLNLYKVMMRLLNKRK